MRAEGIAVVADDDEDARGLVAGVARKLGLRVIEASDGIHLLTCVRDVWQHDEKVMLVISDIGMPQCDGIQATQELLRSEPSLPVVLMTAFSDQATVKSAKASGALLVLRKPFSLSALEKVIAEVQAREQS